MGGRGETYALAVGVVKGLQLHNVGVSHNSHDLELSVLQNVSLGVGGVEGGRQGAPTLNRLSCKTRLMAASSLEGESLVWNTTPNDPLPTILHCVYCISRVSPVTPS